MNIILLFSLLFYSFFSYGAEIPTLTVRPAVPAIAKGDGREQALRQAQDKHPRVEWVNIKVLLNDQSPNNKYVSITAKDDLITHHPKKEKAQRRIGNVLNATLDNNAMYINGKKFNGNSIQIKPSTGYLNFENRDYHGSFILMKDKDSLLLINLLNLEDYVSVVLRTESWPGWPLEANKILAISIRTYAVDKILQARQKKLPYHIKTTTEHQTYKGVLNNKYTDKLMQAVNETAGLIITHNNKPILAMHDSCCAGIIPANVQHIDFTKAPYLARKQACNYCKISKFYRWESTISASDLHDLLLSEIPNLKNLHSISIIKTDPEGIPQKLEIKYNKTKHHMCAKKFYFLNKKIKSYHYTIKKTGKDYKISGRGVGHHLGLCQWGAKHLSDEGWNYKDIIQFYYPGTSFMRLKAK